MSIGLVQAVGAVIRAGPMSTWCPGFQSFQALCQCLEGVPVEELEGRRLESLSSWKYSLRELVRQDYSGKSHALMLL